MIRRLTGFNTHKVSFLIPKCMLFQQNHVNMSRSVQTRWNMDSQTTAQHRTEYDLDKEQWSKQMKFPSMDCIMDPDIRPIRYTSFAGIKKAVRRFVTIKKLLERRPDFSSAELKKLFIQLKIASKAKDLNTVKTLQRITTHAEAVRISKEIKARLNEEFANKSWKALKGQTLENSYEILVDSFDLVTCYMGQMTSDDWLQITYRCEYREREGKEFDWVKMMEYPVFEVRLGDGVSSPNAYPFIVVGVMRKDGTRYGQDGQDAASLRKQFDRNRRFF
ncbi:unnamed protein product [Phytomonas sp. Hart1]|nr:unnamed protein product [Phytomonas sp. Hart1]|eukprot:CCW69783.1 unnamed protein product [Phytomonas sp. isolate Hart1]